MAFDLSRQFTGNQPHLHRALVKLLEKSVTELVKDFKRGPNDCFRDLSVEELRIIEIVRLRMHVICV
jgi:hypothetical protein